LLAVVTRRTAAAALGLPPLRVGGHGPRTLHAIGPEAQALEGPLELGPLAGLVAAGQSLHPLPAVEEGPGLFRRPAKVIEHLPAAPVERIAEVLEGEVGGVAGVLEILIGPLEIALLKRLSVVAAGGGLLGSAGLSAEANLTFSCGSLRVGAALLATRRIGAVAILSRASPLCVTTGLPRLLTSARLTLLTLPLLRLAFSAFALSLLALSLLTLSLLTLSLLTLSLLTLSLLTLSLLTLALLTLSLLTLSLLTLSLLTLSLLTLT
jgi:hypothetical protein